jgi:hypothetical protein
VKITLLRTMAIAGLLAMTSAAHASDLADLYLYLMGGGGK